MTADAAAAERRLFDDFAAAIAERAEVVRQSRIRVTGAASAGLSNVAGVMIRMCACGHRVHANPCCYGVSDAQGDRPCGCPRTCSRCLNLGFVSVRTGPDGDEKEQVDCPRGCPPWPEQAQTL